MLNTTLSTIAAVGQEVCRLTNLAYFILTVMAFIRQCTQNIAASKLVVHNLYIAAT